MTLLRLALTLVLAAFGWFVPPSAAGALADPAPIAIHTYYDDHHTESLMRTATERGPPARDHRTIYDLDGLQRLGHLARPRAATPRLGYTYDHQGPLVSPMGGSQPESRPPSCLTLGLASNHRSDNAANTGQKWAYRGVGRNHPGYDDAMKGRVNPRNPNGTATPEQHNLGNTTDSSYTSWTRDPAIARRFAGEDGVVLRVPRGGGSPYKFEWSPDVYYEQEILIRGPVCGALIC